MKIVIQPEVKLAIAKARNDALAEDLAAVKAELEVFRELIERAEYLLSVVKGSKDLGELNGTTRELLADMNKAIVG